MGSKRAYSALGYRRLSKGTLERGEPQACANADSARLKAEYLATRRGYVGAIAFMCSGSDDQEPITIAAYGDVPPEARDALPF